MLYINITSFHQSIGIHDILRIILMLGDSVVNRIAKTLYLEWSLHSSGEREIIIKIIWGGGSKYYKGKTV